MKTNIKALETSTGILFGKLIADALFAVGGSDYEGWDVDICNIYQLIDGSLIAYDSGVVFSVEETDYKPGRCDFPNNSYYKKRGKHSRSHNKTTQRDIGLKKSFELLADDLPF